MALPTRPLADMLSLVVPQAPGVSDMAAEQALRLSAAEFCVRTRIWREILTCTLSEQGEAIITPDYAALHEIESAYFGPDELYLEPVRFAATTPEDRALLASTGGSPRYITQASANSVTVIPFEAGDLIVAAILKPIEGPEFGVVAGQMAQDIQNVIPTFIHEQYALTIADGALSRLLLQPKTEWFDPMRAEYHEHKFNRAADTSFNKQIKGQQKARRRTTPHWF